jgi:hypothetical protein
MGLIKKDIEFKNNILKQIQQNCQRINLFNFQKFIVNITNNLGYNFT